MCDLFIMAVRNGSFRAETFMKNSRILGYILGALFLFTAGYVIVHGREAKASGSWDIVITHDDELLYWAVAKGASQSPMSDENPYYYEEMGSTMSLPWTTAILTGKIAKWLNVPVMNFFPLWHIGMPFVMWLSMFLCLWKLWRKSPNASAALSMLFLLSTLFFRGQTKILLFRFTRPGDGLWLLFIWLSVVMNPDVKFRFRTFLLSLIAFVTFWLQPFYVLLGVATTLFETLRCLLIRKYEDLKALIAVLLSVTLAGMTFMFYFFLHSGFNSALAKSIVAGNAPAQYYLNKGQFHFISVIFFAVIFLLVVLPAAMTKRQLTPVARLTLYSFFMEPLVANAPILFSWVPNEVFIHRYYLFPVQIACLTGAMLECCSVVYKSSFFLKWERLLVGAVVLSFGVLLIDPATYFFLHAPFFLSSERIDMVIFDHTRLLISILFTLLILVWLYIRLAIIKTLFSWRPFVITLIVSIGLVGYATVPSFMRSINKNYPFVGAFKWLRQYAKKNDVVLVAKPNEVYYNYQLLQTNQKTYYMAMMGREASAHAGDADYREFFYKALLHGQLQGSLLTDSLSVEGRLRRLKLDYVLIDQPSVFLKTIQDQLNGFLKVVYEDKKSILWKVQI